MLIRVHKHSVGKNYMSRTSVSSRTLPHHHLPLPLFSQGTMNTSQIAKAVGLKRMAVARIGQNPANAEQQLVTSGL